MIADFFDTMGTLVGVGSRPATSTRRASCPSPEAAAGRLAGGDRGRRRVASSATTYIESASGVGVGGRTGWCAVVTGAPVLPVPCFSRRWSAIVPTQATAPALIIVGWLMMSTLAESEEEAEPGRRRAIKLAGIDFGDLALGLSAALTIMVIPFTWSITNGIGFGFIAYVVIRVAQRRWRDVHPLMYVIALAFVLYFLVPLIQQEFDV